ncbi:hypothetical protein CHN51_00340 [Sphingorhabdus sp. YGSMI21]|nr:hypothetical protein CHN51_00340 [Sphingorhabdus sp. YGSMI21]
MDDFFAALNALGDLDPFEIYAFDLYIPLACNTILEQEYICGRAITFDSRFRKNNCRFWRRLD